MGNREILARRFANANLHAEVIQGDPPPPPRWMSRDATGVFQMYILGEGRKEYFRIFTGAGNNRVEVQGTDRDLHQLVLLVQEPSRRIVESASRRSVSVDRSKVKVIAEDAFTIRWEHWTDPRKRHFLCGRDERQLFICQLPRPATTVREAHQVLRAPATIGGKGKVVRQGEWFFIDPSPRELEAMEGALRQTRTVIRIRTRISWGGKPHVADELVVVPPTLVGAAMVERTVLVRGRVRHVDHEMVRLRNWTKVVRNTEPLDATGVARFDGIRWID